MQICSNVPCTKKENAYESHILTKNFIYNSIKISLSFYYYVHFLYFIRLLVIHIIKPAIESSIAFH